MNVYKDLAYTNWISAALDGTSRSIKAANAMTFGGVTAMREKAEKYSEPDQ